MLLLNPIDATKENVHGENLALNYGFGSKAATVNTADSILKRWTEDEVDLKWPQNGHLTQVRACYVWEVF